MRQLDLPPSPELIVTAQRILSQHFGAPIRLGAGEDLHGGTRALVYRFPVLDGPASAPPTLIVKQARSTSKAVYHPDSATMPAWTFLNEWASLEFLNNLAPEAAFAPRFYGGDRASGVIIMEDLGYGQRFDQVLAGSDPLAAQAALLEYAAQHGRLHAATTGKQHAYQTLRDALGPSALADDYYSYRWLAPTFYQTFQSLNRA